MESTNEIVRLSRTGENGELKLFSAVQMMQDCSDIWIDSEPAFKQYLQETNMAVFVASRQVNVIRTPLINEKLTITTSVFEYVGSYGYRNTIIYDEQGLPCYACWCIGAFVSLETGRMLIVPAEIAEKTVVDPKYDMDYLERKIPIPENGYREYARIQVKRDDIDRNKHMNNAHYIRIANEFLPSDFNVKTFRIEYKTPAKLGDLLYPKVAKSDDGKMYVILSNEKQKTNAVIEFVK